MNKENEFSSPFFALVSNVWHLGVRLAEHMHAFQINFIKITTLLCKYILYSHMSTQLFDLHKIASSFRARARRAID